MIPRKSPSAVRRGIRVPAWVSSAARALVGDKDLRRDEAGHRWAGPPSALPCCCRDPAGPCTTLRLSGGGPWVLSLPRLACGGGKGGGRAQLQGLRCRRPRHRLLLLARPRPGPLPLPLPPAPLGAPFLLLRLQDPPLHSLPLALGSCGSRMTFRIGGRRLPGFGGPEGFRWICVPDGRSRVTWQGLLGQRQWLGPLQRGSAGGGGDSRSIDRWMDWPSEKLEDRVNEPSKHVLP